jgi:hypothetical protein
MASKQRQRSSASPSGFQRFIAKAMGNADGQGVEPRQKVMAGLVGVLVIGFAVVIIKSVTAPAPAEAAPPFTPGPQGGPAATSSAVSVVADPSGEFWPDVEPYPTDLRDPMVYVFAEETPEPVDTPVADTAEPEEIVVEEDPRPPLRVEAVLMAASPEAVVNGEFVGVGDTISGATVIAIGLDSVEFEFDGECWTEYRQD